jgi:hypothetical protein
METRNTIESSRSSGETIIASVPSQIDVLLGRGKRAQCHPGNLRLHHLLESYFLSYEAKSTNKKSGVHDEVVKTMKRNGSRFLAQGERESGKK